MKIDFRKLKVENVDGTEIEVDISKDLGKSMYLGAFAEEEMNLGKDIYKTGEVELNRVRAAAVKKTADKIFNAFVRVALDVVLKDIISNDSVPD